MYDLTKTLFVSDLDGTLMGSDGKLKKKTAEEINRLVKMGVKFTFATARSYTSAMWVASELELEIPMILHNGVFIRDKKRGIIRSNLIENREYIRETLKKYSLAPFVYTVRDHTERYSYIPKDLTPEAAKYQSTRVNDPRDNPLTDDTALWDGDIYYVLVIDNGGNTEAVYELLKNDYSCLRCRDYYSGDIWLEIFPRAASKAAAVTELKNMLGCEKVVVFGDGANDISMFSVADEAYAVSDAVDALKEIATGVIGSCDDSAVPMWLYENLMKGRL